MSQSTPLTDYEIEEQAEAQADAWAGKWDPPENQGANK